MIKLVVVLVIFWGLGINNAKAWVDINVEDVSIECQDGDCEIEDGDIKIKKHIRNKHKTIYKKDPLVMPIKGNHNSNDPLAMPAKNKKNPQDKLAF